LTVELDEIDRKIIDILRRDSRTPFTNIGKDLGISDATVHIRIKKLLEEGVIKKFTIDINKTFLGKEMCGFALLNIKPGKIEKVVKELVNNENISAVYEIHGPSDLLIKIDVKDLDELRKIMLRIHKISSITGTELITVLKTWKED